MGKTEFFNAFFKLAFVCFLVFQTANCNSEKDLWKKSRQTDTEEVYQSYLKKYPFGTHQDDALIRIAIVRKRVFADNIFLNIKNIYQTKWDLLKKPSVIVLTLSSENEYFLNQQEWDYVWLEFNLRKIYAYKKNKAIFFRIFSKSADYQKIIELLDILKDVGIEEIIPVITPELEKILGDRFHSRLDLEAVKSIMKRSLPIIIPGGVELEPDDPDFMEPRIDDLLEYQMKFSKPIGLQKGEKPKLLKTGKIEYPELFPELAGLKNEMITARIETDIFGRAHDVKIVKCHTSLWEAQKVVIQAIKNWVYEPYLLNGVPRKVIFIEEISFNTLY